MKETKWFLIRKKEYERNRVLSFSIVQCFFLSFLKANKLRIKWGETKKKMQLDDKWTEHKHQIS